jgi:predicted small metal-binding protein
MEGSEPDAAPLLTEGRVSLHDGEFLRLVANRLWRLSVFKQLRCRDVGLDCDFQARGTTEEEVLQKAVVHARTAHHLTEMPSELASKVRAAIRDA